jgi:uncharacterized membrane protein YfcA
MMPLNEGGASVEELVPFVLGVVLGALIWVATTGRIRYALSASAVVASGLAATVLSAEYQQSWVYLLLDLGEAAIGLAIGTLIGSRVQSRRVAARVRSSTETQVPS